MYLDLPSFTGFFLGFTGFVPSFISFLPGFTTLYLVLLVFFTGFHWVLLGFTHSGLDQTVPRLTGDQVIMEFD